MPRVGLQPGLGPGRGGPGTGTSRRAASLRFCYTLLVVSQIYTTPGVASMPVWKCTHPSYGISKTGLSLNLNPDTGVVIIHTVATRPFGLIQSLALFPLPGCYPLLESCTLTTRVHNIYTARACIRHTAAHDTRERAHTHSKTTQHIHDK